MSNSSACEQFVVLMKKSNQFDEVIVWNLKTRSFFTTKGWAFALREASKNKKNQNQQRNRIKDYDYKAKGTYC